MPDPVLGRAVLRVPLDERSLRRAARTTGRQRSRGWRAARWTASSTALPETERWCVDRSSSACSPFVGPDLQPDVMSYVDRRDIPNYWAYADAFVLQDRMFAPTDSWTLPAHLFLVSGWSASCLDPGRSDVVRLERGPKEEEERLRLRRAADLRVDRHHVAAGPRRGVVGVLRGARHLLVPAVRRRRWFRGRHDTLDEEPAPGLRHAARDRPAGQHPNACGLPAGRGAREAPVGLLDRAGQRRERTSAVEPGIAAGHGVRDPAREHRDAQPGVGAHGDLPHVGRLGWVLRSRACLP